MAVKTYSLKKNGDKKLSDHFRVREFRCKDGTDKILIESKVITTLEKVYDHFDCSKIIINSGYRTPTHDKKVGGSGRGSHCEGKAVDFVAYDKKGNKIPSKNIVLYLEDLGILGIGYRCGRSSTATHMDINYRSKKWYGDEYYSMSGSVGSSFYPYLGVKYATKRVRVDSSLKARKEPGLKGKVAKKLKNGEKIAVANSYSITKDGYLWVRVKIDGKHYWVANKYLR